MSNCESPFQSENSVPVVDCLILSDRLYQEVQCVCVCGWEEATRREGEDTKREDQEKTHVKYHTFLPNDNPI